MKLCTELYCLVFVDATSNEVFLVLHDAYGEYDKNILICKKRWLFNTIINTTINRCCCLLCKDHGKVMVGRGYDGCMVKDAGSCCSRKWTMNSITLHLVVVHSDANWCWFWRVASGIIHNFKIAGRRGHRPGGGNTPPHAACGRGPRTTAAGEAWQQFPTDPTSIISSRRRTSWTRINRSPSAPLNPQVRRAVSAAAKSR